jgi:hypothetical protein
MRRDAIRITPQGGRMSRSAIAWASTALLAIGCARGPSATEAYAAYRTAFDKAKTVDEILPYASRAKRAAIEKEPAERRKHGFETAQELEQLAEFKVVKESPSGEEVILEAQGTTAYGAEATGRIVMVTEDGTYKVENEAWTSKTPDARPGPERTCDAMAADLKGPSAAARARAAAGLQSRAYGSEACSTAIPALVDALGDPMGGIRGNAANALGGTLAGMRRDHPEALEALASTFPRLAAAKDAARKRDDLVMELSLLKSVAAFGAPAVPYLIDDLSGKERELRFGAATGLKIMGRVAKDALPALESAAQREKDETVRTAMDEALREIRASADR